MGIEGSGRGSCNVGVYSVIGEVLVTLEPRCSLWLLVILPLMEEEAEKEIGQEDGLELEVEESKERKLKGRKMKEGKERWKKVRMSRRYEIYMAEYSCLWQNCVMIRRH